ncbi:MAG: DUF2281 domain-containing protein [Pyrinomonadaceae bacterium]
MIAELSEGEWAEVRVFVERLIKKREEQPRRFLRQSWAGALADYRDQFTSLDLQKMSSDKRHY